MLTFYYGNWDYWDIEHKVTFDGSQKLILISPGTLAIDVKTDIYSDWKEWSLLRDNSKYIPALNSIGGDPTVGTQSLAPTFFLINGWKIRTWEGNHRLVVNGNLFSDDGSSPFVSTLEPHNITISMQTSSIVTQIEAAAPGGLTAEENARLFQLPLSTLSTDERDKLLSLNNLDMLYLIDAIWDKEIAPGMSAAEYIVKKLLTTNKYIGLQ